MQIQMHIISSLEGVYSLLVEDKIIKIKETEKSDMNFYIDTCRKLRNKKKIGWQIKYVVTLPGVQKDDSMLRTSYWKHYSLILLVFSNLLINNSFLPFTALKTISWRKDFLNTISIFLFPVWAPDIGERPHARQKAVYLNPHQL